MKNLEEFAQQNVSLSFFFSFVWSNEQDDRHSSQKQKKNVFFASNQQKKRKMLKQNDDEEKMFDRTSFKLNGCFELFGRPPNQ